MRIHRHRVSDALTVTAIVSVCVCVLDAFDALDLDTRQLLPLAHDS